MKVGTNYWYKDTWSNERHLIHILQIHRVYAHVDYSIKSSLDLTPRLETSKLGTMLELIKQGRLVLIEQHPKNFPKEIKGGNV